LEVRRPRVVLIRVPFTHAARLSAPMGAPEQEERVPMTKITPEDLEQAGQQPHRETALEKTARAAREIMDDEAEARREKTEKLRKARLRQKG